VQQLIRIGRTGALSFCPLHKERVRNDLGASLLAEQSLEQFGGADRAPVREREARMGNCMLGNRPAGKRRQGRALRSPDAPGCFTGGFRQNWALLLAKETN